MNDLFDNYPNTPGYAKNSATSKHASRTLKIVDQIKEIILEALRDHPNGVTVDQVKVMAERKMKRTFDRTTIGARFTELEMAEKKIKKTDRTALTPRGRPATIYQSSN